MNGQGCPVPAQDLAPLIGFLASYLLLLLTPGPNMLAVGSLAAARGLRGALPLCLGIALGAGTLATLLLVATEALARQANSLAPLRLVGAAALLALALRLARGRRLPQAELPPPSRLGSLMAGYCVAIGNPLTASFFAAQFLGMTALPGSPAPKPALVVTAMATAFAANVILAALLSGTRARRLAASWAARVRLVAAFGLTAAAAAMAWDVMWE
ncbi:LysE family transporter [Siccirubricoccus sp. KC 17139]|uniref:LysE family transporter n=1 Tax=Siccirubricoccus soli TaxID=2899147 RepID=A0ABT1D1G5_9PROT|nr:LysE family transporter [Siccirubricoccus soli]MCO6415762.1 LysE family transporter [Siccirubricoccus soli]MCP2681894.1 LysE family transporter [Siccirubricoccus soli]